MWRNRSAGVVDGDEMGQTALSVDGDLRNRLAERFGRDILDSDGKVIRPKLAETAFKSPGGTEELTRLTFPALYQLARERFSYLADAHKVIAFDAALIFEWGIEGDFDLVVTVTAPEEALIRRAAARLGIDRAQAAARLNGQVSREEKIRRADRVIVNDGSIHDLERKAAELWEEIISIKKG